MEVDVNTGVTSGEVTLIGVVTPPAPATYQVLIEANGAASNREHAIVAVQLTVAP